MWNNLLVPKLLYHMECLIPETKSNAYIEHLGRSLLLGLADIPRFLVDKTLYSDRHLGVGAHHFLTRHPQRVLDMAERTLRRIANPTHQDPCVRHLLHTMAMAASSLGAEMDPSLPFGLSPIAEPLDPCPVQELEPAPPQDAIYTDGSFDGQRCAASVLEASGQTWALRPPADHQHTKRNYMDWNWEPC